jgi:hypothetical protein
MLLGRTGDPHATVHRLFTSQHVRELRWIVIGALSLLWATMSWVLLNNNADEFKYITSALGVFGAVLAWAYKVGSARLGVVDLFACEISTLCRVATIFDYVGQRVDSFNQGPPRESVHSSGPDHFTSRENYFPVFDTCAKDLQTLEAEVVVHITAFYTYMKAARDMMRKLLETRSDPTNFTHPQPDWLAPTGPWHTAARNLVYTLFLGLESARKAISDLVEFEPQQAERKIVILLSELGAYQFLREQAAFQSRSRNDRIKLRRRDYEDLVPHLRRVVRTKGRARPRRSITRRNAERLVIDVGRVVGDVRRLVSRWVGGWRPNKPDVDRPPVSQWEPARLLLDELGSRYNAALATEDLKSNDGRGSFPLLDRVTALPYAMLRKV